jgi:cellulose synthase/poly-beta-1,6-N-acetylglucosamine synthase-like glycosyltransferase
VYGLHRAWLVFIYLSRRPPATASAEADEGEVARWPVVTVQLPLYNERCVVRRLVEAACALRYPEGRLEIQVLDDSTDETRAVAAGLVASYRALGRDIHHFTRSTREGFKAGALAHGLARARGELIAVFDADFVPGPDFLLRCVPRFAGDADGRLGMVQARWGHLNRDASWLTRVQALMLDAHFVVEHGARRVAGRFLNFNGTAGLFRRRCIEEAGGWQADTLTEDLDLSYRAQLAGWRFEPVEEIEVPAELPEQVTALKSQQRRWAKGSIQTAVKLLPRVMRAPLPAGVKLEAFFHLTANVPYLLMAALALLIVPALRARTGVAWTWLALDLPLLAAGTGSFALFCAVAQRRLRGDWLRAILSLPALMGIGMGLCVNNGLAVIEGLFARSSAPFHRTPKSGLARGEAAATEGAYGMPVSPVVILEAVLAAHFIRASAVEAAAGRWTLLPFLLLFAAGFSYVTVLTLGQARFVPTQPLRVGGHS